MGEGESGVALSKFEAPNLELPSPPILVFALDICPLYRQLALAGSPLSLLPVINGALIDGRASESCGDLNFSLEGGGTFQVGLPPAEEEKEPEVIYGGQ